MKTDNLDTFIVEFREWIDRFGMPCLSDVQASPIDGWHRELSDIKRILSDQPELPIAFIGPSQQGKSTLINALLGENILAVGGAIGACTCVITSIQYCDAPGFRAEIDFIPFEDWRAELKAIHEAMMARASEEDTEKDREELETEQKAARDKYTSVYREEPPKDLDPLLEHPTLRLPDEISARMASREPIIIEVDCIQPLRNKIRRYLVGREQHEDGQYWPLISAVRIFGKFEALSNGVSFIDLPGLNDPNPAREQVTKRYLEKARYVWLVCNSQTGIDRVFTHVLRENGFLFRLFMDGRLDAFSVIATRIDDINIDAILEEMGRREDEPYVNADVLDHRRQRIQTAITERLSDIARDIASRTDDVSAVRDVFFNRIRSIPVFSVSATAYLHAIKRLKNYQGLPLTAEETHVPNLIEHLKKITGEDSRQSRVDACYRRLELLQDRVHSFFLGQIHDVEQESEDARQEGATLRRETAQALLESRNCLRTLRIRNEQSLCERANDFQQQLRSAEARASHALQTVYNDWTSVNWRSLQAAVKRGGRWYSRTLGRDFDFNRDIAQSYLGLLPFVWDEFFNNRLARLIDEVRSETRGEMEKAVRQIKGCMGMMRHQPPELRERMETSLRTAGDSFQLQSGQIRAELTALVQRTRQKLSVGMEETVADFMNDAYAKAADDRGGTGVKNRMLDILVQCAGQNAPALFINMQKELAEGVDMLCSTMKPQLYSLIAYGEERLDSFEQNMGTLQVTTPLRKRQIEQALERQPRIG